MKIRQTKFLPRLDRKTVLQISSTKNKPVPNGAAVRDRRVFYALPCLSAGGFSVSSLDPRSRRERSRQQRCRPGLSRRPRGSPGLRCRSCSCRIEFVRRNDVLAVGRSVHVRKTGRRPAGRTTAENIRNHGAGRKEDPRENAAQGFFFVLRFPARHDIMKAK